MSRIRMLRRFGVAAAILCSAEIASAQTSTKSIAFDPGSSVVGAFEGSLSATVKQQSNDGTVNSGARLNIKDLDVRSRPRQPISIFPSSTVRNVRASGGISISNTTVGVDIDPVQINSGLSGYVNVTAGDKRSNKTVGVLDGGISGSDGAWDDPGKRGVLNNGRVDKVSLTIDDDINASANVNGGLNFNLQNGVKLPNVIQSLLIFADLRIKRSSSIKVNFDPVQNVSIKNLTVTSEAPLPVHTPLSNFIEANHPTGVPQRDLSGSASGLVRSTISGIFTGDLLGSVTAKLDLAADIRLAGVVPFTIDMNNALNQSLDPGEPLVSLNETLALPGIELPFAISLLHEPTSDVDFDDLAAEIRAGTFGLEFPVALSQEAILAIPEFDYELSGLSFGIDLPLFQGGDFFLDHLAIGLTGDIVLDLDADLKFTLDVLASAVERSAINVVPEPTSLTFVAIGCCGCVGVRARRRV